MCVCVSQNRETTSQKTDRERTPTIRGGLTFYFNLDRTDCTPIPIPSQMSFCLPSVSSVKTDFQSGPPVPGRCSKDHWIETAGVTLVVAREIRGASCGPIDSPVFNGSTLKKHVVGGAPSQDLTGGFVCTTR